MNEGDQSQTSPSYCSHPHWRDNHEDSDSSTMGTSAKKAGQDSMSSVPLNIYLSGFTSSLLCSTYLYSKLYFTMGSWRQSSGKSRVSHSSVEPVCTSPKACPEAVFMYLTPVFKKHVFRRLELLSPVSFSLHGILQLLKLWPFLISSIILSWWKIFIC